MRNPRRPSAFVLAASDHGTLIVNRFDRRIVEGNRGYGVGFQVLESSAFDASEVDLALALLELRRKHFGDGVVAVDCGANIGVHSIEWAKRMTGWGSVVAIEAQERIFYALAGNIAINNCFNARAIHAAVAAEDGTMAIPTPDYLRPGSFGSLELRRRDSNEFIGQPIDYSPESLSSVRTLKLDSLPVPRLDFLKVDVEGMELEVLHGAAALIGRHRPLMMIEHIKTDQRQLGQFLATRGYGLHKVAINLLAIHGEDPCRNDIKFQ